MSLTIYLDDCSDDNRLIHSLTLAGHTVISPRSTNTKDLDDGDHLRYAAAHGYCVLTHNPADFRRLHRDWQDRGFTHSGIFVIYRDNNIRKDMNNIDIVRSIANLSASNLPIANEIHILNQWR